LNIVLGPPGTGKTTKLLDLVVQEMKSGVPPDRIAYLAFTKQAAHVAISRAQAEFNLTSTDLPFFRTIHSLAFNLLGLSRQSVLSREHLDDLSPRRS
jgi:superfamily I DNA/RNA helicase